MTIEKLIKLANDLDKLGLYDEANQLDEIISLADIPSQLPDQSPTGVPQGVQSQPLVPPPTGAPQAGQVVPPGSVAHRNRAPVPTKRYIKRQVVQNIKSSVNPKYMKMKWTRSMLNVIAGQLLPSLLDAHRRAPRAAYIKYRDQAIMNSSAMLVSMMQAKDATISMLNVYNIRTKIMVSLRGKIGDLANESSFQGYINTWSQWIYDRVSPWSNAQVKTVSPMELEKMTRRKLDQEIENLTSLVAQKLKQPGEETL